MNNPDRNGLTVSTQGILPRHSKRYGERNHDGPGFRDDDRIGDLRALRPATAPCLGPHTAPVRVAHASVIPHELPPHATGAVRVSRLGLRRDHRPRLLRRRVRPAPSLLLRRPAGRLRCTALVHRHHGRGAVRVRLRKDLLREWLVRATEYAKGPHRGRTDGPGWRGRCRIGHGTGEGIPDACG